MSYWFCHPLLSDNSIIIFVLQYEVEFVLVLFPDFVWFCLTFPVLLVSHQTYWTVEKDITTKILGLNIRNDRDCVFTDILHTCCTILHVQCSILCVTAVGSTGKLHCRMRVHEVIKVCNHLFIIYLFIYLFIYLKITDTSFLANPYKRRGFIVEPK